MKKLREAEGVTVGTVFNYDSVYVRQTIIDIYLKNKIRAAKEVLNISMKDKATYLTQQAAAGDVLALDRELSKLTNAQLKTILLPLKYICDGTVHSTKVKMLKVYNEWKDRMLPVFGVAPLPEQSDGEEVEEENISLEDQYIDVGERMDVDKRAKIDPMMDLAGEGLA